MKDTAVFTSTISTKLLKWLNQYSKDKQMTKRAIIEEALKKYRHDERREELRRGFKQMADDPEQLEMAEWGLSDWVEQIKNYEES